jgi:hypothetical protein
MSGTTASQFTATGPATTGFQTQPPDTNTQFSVGLEASGVYTGVRGTGTQGEIIPSTPGSAGVGVQGNGSGVGWGVAGYGGNATPGTVHVDASASAGVRGQGGQAPQAGGPGVFGVGGASSGAGVFGQGGTSSGIGVFGQGGAPAQQSQPGGPGVKGIGGGNPSVDNADGVQGFGLGAFSGVAGWGGGNSGAGVFGQGGAPTQPSQPGGPGVRGIGAGNPNAGNADGVQGFGSGTFSGVAGWGGGSSGTGAVGFGGGPVGPGVRGIGAGAPNADPGGPVGVFGQGGPNADGVQGVGSGAGAGVRGFGAFGVRGTAGPDNGSTAVFAEGHPGAIGIFATAGQAGFFSGDVDIVQGSLSVSGNFSVLSPGVKSVVVPFPDGSHRQLYCMESPESWFEDFGVGHLVDGRAAIQLDPDFAATVSTSEYHVFIAEYDDNNALFVTNRTKAGFEVRAKTAVRVATFSYRVVAKRKDIVPARLAKVTLPKTRDGAVPIPARG